MYLKVSDQIVALSADIVVAGMSKQQMNEFMKNMSPEDFAEGLKKWKSKSASQEVTAGITRDAIVFMQILTTLLGAAAAAPSRDDVADEIAKLQQKGGVTVEQITDFKKDLPPEATGAGGGVQDYSKINKLVEEARGQSVQQKTKEEGFSSAPISIGDQKFLPSNPREFAALQEMKKIVDKLERDKAPDYEQVVEKLQMAFKTKKPVK